ncbi:hypothetical protein BD309DRAFT_877998 [Dichomitus squalens]|nr:hypothetical protein BD309DRAFT_877998 [Dichomitus squalens]
MWKHVYDCSVPLPSLYHIAVRQHPFMKQARNFEYDFRRLTADRALRDVRVSIIKREVVNMKKRQSNFKKTTENMEWRINAVNTELNQLADHYRRHWVALSTLGLEESDPVFRRLRDADVVRFDMGTSQNVLGQSKRQMSWIWGDFSFVVVLALPCVMLTASARRVHWFRSSAFAARWTEEVNLLKEEMHRTLRFHTYRRDKWNDHTREKERMNNAGAAAYARK